MLRTVVITSALVASVAMSAAAQDQKVVDKGRDLTVKNHCAMCHVIGGRGGKVAKPLDGVGSRQDAAALRRILTDPQKEFPDAKVKMPKVAWAQGDIEAVIAYLQTLK